MYRGALNLSRRNYRCTDSGVTDRDGCGCVLRTESVVGMDFTATHDSDIDNRVLFICPKDV